MSTAHGPSGPGILLLCQSRRLLALADHTVWPHLALPRPQGWSSPALHRHLVQGPGSHGQSPLLLPGLPRSSPSFPSFLSFSPTLSLSLSPLHVQRPMTQYCLVTSILKEGVCFEERLGFFNLSPPPPTEPPVFISGEFVLSWFLLI